MFAKLYYTLCSEDNRSSCKMIGGSPHQSYEDCLGDHTEPCDEFYEENCEFSGEDTITDLVGYLILLQVLRKKAIKDAGLENGL